MWTFGEVTGKKVDCLTHSLWLSTVLLKDEEFAIDFAYDIKKLLLTVVTLVSPVIWTLMMTNINLIWTNFDWLTDRHWPLITRKVVLPRHFLFVSRQMRRVIVGFSVRPPLSMTSELNDANISVKEFFQQLFWVAESCMTDCFTQFLSMANFWTLFHKVV